MSRDFEHPESNGPWWGWKPQKAALEYLWRIGKLTVCARTNFHKVYDLMERVYGDVEELETPSAEEHVDWACSEALARLGCATPAELAGFFNAVDLKAAQGWAKRVVADGRAVEVMVEAGDGSKPRKAVARTDWRAHVGRFKPAPDMIRLLSPFDPAVRDRKRLLRLFDFEYRFEAFTPAAKRRYGYYVMPLLEGERLVGRLDAKLHRKEGRLEVLGLWWEEGVKATKARKTKLAEALDAYAGHLGAQAWEMRGAGRGI
jgi:uncharacterized protein YcaQ